MTASAYLIWRDLAEEESLEAGDAPPAFRDPNWAEWISFIIDDDGEPVVRALGCGALLAYSTEGLPPEKIEWASPQEMIAAADRLAGLVRAGSGSVEELVALYEDHADRGKPRAELLVEDLAVVRAMGEWLLRSGKTGGAFELAF